MCLIWNFEMCSFKSNSYSKFKIFLFQFKLKIVIHPCDNVYELKPNTSFYTDESNVSGWGRFYLSIFLYNLKSNYYACAGLVVATLLGRFVITNVYSDNKTDRIFFYNRWNYNVVRLLKQSKAWTVHNKAYLYVFFLHVVFRIWYNRSLF